MNYKNYLNQNEGRLIQEITEVIILHLGLAAFEMVLDSKTNVNNLIDIYKVLGKYFFKSERGAFQIHPALVAQQSSIHPI